MPEYVLASLSNKKHNFLDENNGVNVAKQDFAPDDDTLPYRLPILQPFKSSSNPHILNCQPLLPENQNQRSISPTPLFCRNGDLNHPSMIAGNADDPSSNLCQNKSNRSVSAPVHRPVSPKNTSSSSYSSSMNGSSIKSWIPSKPTGPMVSSSSITSSNLNTISQAHISTPTTHINNVKVLFGPISPPTGLSTGYPRVITPLSHILPHLTSTTIAPPSSSPPKSVVLSSEPLIKPIVKETHAVKRNHASLPQQLIHASPVMGDWLKQRYLVNNYILLDTLGTGSYAEVRRMIKCFFLSYN
jgi:hypothetical protein